MSVSLSPLRVGVIGAGYFGRFHAAKYAQMQGVELVAVADTNGGRARAVAEEFATSATDDYRTLTDRVDAVSIATPATTHFEVAAAFLERGRHVLVEKPIACALDDADELIALAEREDAVLQIGHQERFYFAQFDLADLVADPREISCRRAGPFTGRGTDCTVVCDVMIHDLDLLNQIAVDPPVWRAGRGERVRSNLHDVADVSLDLGGGCTAQLYASRVDSRRERRLRIVGADSRLDIDFVNQTFVCAPALARGAGPGTMGNFTRDWLAHELSAFINSIRSAEPPLVGGEDGRRALALALLIDQNLDTFPVARKA